MAGTDEQNLCQAAQDQRGAVTELLSGIAPLTRSEQQVVVLAQAELDGSAQRLGA